jgi:SAM-dependent methyltransferase
LESSKLQNSLIQGLNPSIWRRYDIQDHENFRHRIIADFLSSIFVKKTVKTILDIGSGSQPYRSIAEQIGLKYTAHDFAKYTIEDSNDFFGLHNSEAPNVFPEIICDAMDIPENSKFDVILCTEVLEHIPDPVALLEKAVNLCKPGGFLIFTVPGSSWTHQAPYYFSSGLSPFWFEFHLKKFGASVINGIVIGNLRTNTFQSMASLESIYPKSLMRVIGVLYRIAFSLTSQTKLNAAPVFLAPISQVIVLIEKNA